MDLGRTMERDGRVFEASGRLGGLGRGRPPWINLLCSRFPLSPYRPDNQMGVTGDTNGEILATMLETFSSF